MPVTNVTQDRSAVDGFFSAGLEESDPELFLAVEGELTDSWNMYGRFPPPITRCSISSPRA
jgi:hypothetical protein